MWKLPGPGINPVSPTLLGEFPSTGPPGKWKWKLVLFANYMDCSSSGSSVYRILQARILEWVAIPFSRGSSQPRDWTWVSCTEGRFFTAWVTREVPHKLFILFYFICCCITHISFLKTDTPRGKLTCPIYMQISRVWLGPNSISSITFTVNLILIIQLNLYMPGTMSALQALCHLMLKTMWRGFLLSFPFYRWWHQALQRLDKWTRSHHQQVAASDLDTDTDLVLENHPPPTPVPGFGDIKLDETVPSLKVLSVEQEKQISFATWILKKPWPPLVRYLISVRGVQ